MVNCWTISTEGTSAARVIDSARGAAPSPSFPYLAGRSRSLARTAIPSVHLPKAGTPRHRRRGMLKTSQRPRENSIGLHSQNVAGFPKHPERCAEWFGHFRQRESRGSINLVLLQETRVSVGEAASLNKFYNTTWGFVDKPGRTRWTESEEARGGVAILLNPYSSITEMEQWHETHWTPHWMAVRITIQGETVLVVNVYAPSGKTEREAFYEMLRHHLLGHDGPLFLGGDFNCTLVPRHDRSFVSPPGRHDSLTLRRLLGRAQLCDVLEDDMEQAEEERAISAFHAAAHTYFYTLPGGGSASSRLDRWYVSARHADWIRDVDLSVPGPAADHNGISIRIVAPRHVVRVRKPRRVYPVPCCAQATATSAILAAIEMAQIEVYESISVPTSDYRTAQRLADWWDGWKIKLRKVLLATTKTARQGLTRSYRQRLKRLYVRLDAALLKARSSANSLACAQAICDQPSPVDTPVELRRSVAECRRLWQKTKKERLLVQHTYTPGETSRRFYARVSTKFQDNTIVSLGGKATYGPNRSQELADEMADGWEHIMTHSFDCPDATDAFLGRASTPDRVDDSTVTSAISPKDVCAALKRLKRGKATGPDEINNTFYRDYADELAPILAALYTRWMECSVLPTSFGEANIQCLKKTAASTLPLDHRPIALLNRDYKLFTKILSFRVRTMLSHIVLPAQVGFVPQRSIHTALDIFSAARKAASADSNLHGAIVLLLDFAKAYDTFQRPFLLSALTWIGFSPQFVSVVAALHRDTTCQFIVNGYRSSRRKVHCGIRQGCPLAPLLFILALDSVYRVIQERDDIRGIPLTSGARTTDFKVSGYADDTAVYLRDRSAVLPVVTILDDFAAVSGLQTNRAKSMIIELDHHGSSLPLDTCGLNLQSSNGSCRYLGVLVSQQDTVTDNCTKCIRSLWSRLVLAREKTHTVEQRARLASAIAVPKITYLARHCWPPPAMVTRLQGLIMDFVWGVRDGRRSRPWVPSEMASLPIQQGGLSVPCIRTELMTMAATAVGQWAATVSSRDLLIGDFLWGSTDSGPAYITPCWTPDHDPRLRATLWLTGSKIVGLSAARHARQGEVKEVCRRAVSFTSRTVVDYNGDGSVTIDVCRVLDDKLRAGMRAEVATSGRFELRWIVHATLMDMSWLRDRRGNAYTLNGADFARGYKYLGDIMTWETTQSGIVRFSPKRDMATHSMAKRQHFGTFCLALIYNFPALVYRSVESGALIAYSTKVYQYRNWLLDRDGTSVSHFDTGMAGGVAPVTSMTDCDTAACLDSETTVHFGAHPTLTRVVHLWAGRRRWRPKRRKLKQIISRRRSDKGKRMCDERVEKTDFQVIAAGTSLIEWRDIRRIRASFPTNAQMLYRLKSNSFPLWNWASQDLSCPHPACSTSCPAMASHVFWNCPSARRHWDYRIERWRKLGDMKEADLHVWVFGMDLPGLPSSAWDAIKHTFDPGVDLSRAKDAVFPASRELWRFLVSATLHSIWVERLRRLKDSSLPHEVHNARARTQFRRAVTRFRRSTYQPDMGEDGHLFARVRSALADTLFCFDEPPPLRAMPLDNLSGIFYLLFFDEGSRGNPGPGGAGSVIVQLHIQTHAACVLWVSSMAYGSANITNNVAEYWGLVHGLRQAKVSGYSPLHVVGGSALVLSQLRTQHPPRKPHLALLFREARAIAEDIDVPSWGHHYRTYNKMADRLANIAMDTGASIQVHASTEEGVVKEATAFLDNDVNHWLEAS